MSVIEGSCQCGEIEYQIIDNSIFNVACHCSHCRKITGYSFSTNGNIDSSLFTIIQGQKVLDRVNHGQHYRYHCSKCHGWVYGDSEVYQGMTFIPCGTLNEAPIKSVDHHVYVDSKAPWIEINDDLPQYPGAQPIQNLSDEGTS